MIDLPYYLIAPSADDPIAPLTKFWNAAPGAYIAQCAGFGLDPTSTNITYCNPFPVATSTQTVPMVVTLPNSHSGRRKPASGWPVVIFQHGITRNRTDAFAVAGTLAAQGYRGRRDRPAAARHHRHGEPVLRGQHAVRALGATRAHVRSRSSRTIRPARPVRTARSIRRARWFINLSSLLTSRDNLRQGVADLFELAHAVSSMHYSANADFDGSRIAFVGQSLGSIVGTMFVTIDPNVNTALLNVPGGGIARLLDGSPTFGPRIRAGLAAAGVEAGTPEYDAFMVAAQTAVDSGDPINFGGVTAQPSAC